MKTDADGRAMRPAHPRFLLPKPRRVPAEACVFGGMLRRLNNSFRDEFGVVTALAPIGCAVAVSAFGCSVGRPSRSIRRGNHAGRPLLSVTYDRIIVEPFWPPKIQKFRSPRPPKLSKSRRSPAGWVGSTPSAAETATAPGPGIAMGTRVHYWPARRQDEEVGQPSGRRGSSPQPRQVSRCLRNPPGTSGLAVRRSVTQPARRSVRHPHGPGASRPQGCPNRNE